MDIADGIPQGKGLDQWESAPIEGFDSRVLGPATISPRWTRTFSSSAGIARKPGMSRDDLLKTNANVIRSVSREITGLLGFDHHNGHQSPRCYGSGVDGGIGLPS